MEDRKSTLAGVAKAPIIPQWISVVAVTAAITGAVNGGAVPKGMYFVSVVGVITIASVLVWPILYAALSKIRAARERKTVRESFGLKVLGLCEALRLLSERSHQYSAGSMLNKSYGDNQRVFTPSFERAYQITLLVLFDRLEDIKDGAADSPLETLRALHVWWDRYIQLYESVRCELRTVINLGKCPPPFVDCLIRDWSQVHQRAAELRNTYLQLVHEISARGEEYVVSPHVPILGVL